MIVAGKEVTVIDTVTLDGLEKGTTYQLKGWQMVKSENAELLMDGQRVESAIPLLQKIGVWKWRLPLHSTPAFGGKDLGDL